jgi:hypothetical protein
MVFPHEKEVKDIGFTNQPCKKKQNMCSNPEKGGPDFFACLGLKISKF